MKITAIKSCNQLFIWCIVLQLLLNTVIFVINIFNSENSTVYVVLGSVQMFLGLCIGLYLRQKNKAILLEQDQARKRFAAIALAGLACVLIVICIPDIIAMPYAYVTTAMYNLTGLSGLFTIFDFSSIVICLGSVFLGAGLRSGVPQ